ncbi:MAG: hypothetical protein SVT52_06385 [Planctomycetota bacterium]|nr:hypothetical protein [Planctomycetota bacterium]
MRAFRPSECVSSEEFGVDGEALDPYKEANIQLYTERAEGELPLFESTGGGNWLEAGKGQFTLQQWP